MESTLTILITAHLLGDFVLQTRQLVDRKRRPRVFLLHIVLVTLITAALLGSLNLIILGVTCASHAVIDAGKLIAESRRLGTELSRFIIDQSLHVGVAVALATAVPDAAEHGWWLAQTTTEGGQAYLAVLTLVSGIVLTITVGGIVISMLTRPLLVQVKSRSRDNQDPATESPQQETDPGAPTSDLEGLKRGGQYIGWLERSLVFLLVLLNQPGGVGFIVAAKSILRFGEIKDAQQRRMAEYVIIGTFLSFGWGLLFAALTQRILLHWLQ